MSRRNWLMTSLSMLAVCCLGASVAFAQAPGQAALAAYTPADGENYFALSLTPPAGVGSSGARHIAVLFDTSASQVGPHREKAMETLRSFLAQLQPEDRVQLVAVDLKAVPMTTAEVAPGSAELKAALDKLTQREPLGATDMQVALEEGAATLASAPLDRRAVVYIGDGMSSGNLLQSASFEKLTGRLADAHVPVSSYAVGPQLDNQLLAALANQTGGMLAVDGERVTSDAAGRYLADAAHAAVVWPTSVELPAGLSEVYPKRLPPLRADRDTVLLGVGQLDAASDLKVAADVDGKPAELAWTVEPAKSSADNAYLPKLVELARRDAGATLPTIGTAGLAEVRRMMDVAVDDLNRLGRQAVATGALDQAEQLAGEAAAIQPHSTDAMAITGAVAQLRQADPAAEDDLRLVEEPVAEEPVDADGTLLENVENRQRILAGALQAEVQGRLHAAQRLMRDDPATAVEALKLVLQHVRGDSTVEPAVREQLANQIEAQLVIASRQTVIRDENVIRQQQAEAAAAERRRLNEQLFAREEQLDQLIARFDALMDEGRYADAQQVAIVAHEIGPLVPATEVALQSGSMTGYFASAYDLRVRRQIGVVDTLATVEASHIPTPDEPPIYYPDPEVWERLTERRKEFASVSLESLKPAEKKIIEELDKPTTLDFVETPLSEVVQYLEDLHKIQIELDAKALEEAGVATDTPITRNLKEITLRSALRLMLGDLDLTYVIKDEVLNLTTLDAAQEQLTTRVYPVADLVVPIQSMGGGMEAWVE